MHKKANMIFISGVPDSVRVGDQVTMKVVLKEAQDFVSDAEITVQVEDFSVAHVMEKPDMSSISIPDDAMDDREMRESYTDMFASIPTAVSTQETDQGGQAEFVINFLTQGVTRLFVSWEDRGEVRTEEVKVVVFHSGADLVSDPDSLIVAGEFNPDEGRVTDMLKGIPRLAVDVEGDLHHQESLGMEKFSYLAAHEGEDQDFDPEIISLDEEIQEVPEEMDDEEYAELKEILHAEVDAPDELRFGGEGVIRVQIRNTWGGMAGEMVELESLMPSVSVFSNNRQSGSPSVISDQTGEDGFVEFRISHVGTKAEDVRMVIRWDYWKKPEEEPKTTELLIRVRARSLHPVVKSPDRAEVGSRVQIKLHVHELGEPVRGIPVTIKSDSGDVAFFLITRDSRADVKSDCANTDIEGNVIFQMRHQGKESGTVKFFIEWDRDGIKETIHSSSIDFFKPEEVIHQEEAMTQNTGDKKKSANSKKGVKKSHIVVWSVVGMLFVACVIGAWVAADYGVFNPKQSIYAVAPDMPDRPEAHIAVDDPVPLDTELPAPNELDEESEEDMVFASDELLESGEETGDDEQLPPSDEDETPLAIAPDAMTYDVKTETILVYSDSLSKDLEQSKVNKIKLNKAKKEVEDLERRLKKADDVNFSLIASNDSYESEIESLRQEIASLQSGEPNLALIKVDKIECTGKYKEIKNKKKEIIGVKIPLCKVYLSTIDSK